MTKNDRLRTLTWVCALLILVPARAEEPVEPEASLPPVVEYPREDVSVTRSSAVSDRRDDDTAESEDQSSHEQPATRTRLPRAVIHARIPKALPRLPGSRRARDEEVRQAQVPAQPALPRPRAPRAPVPGDAATSVPRARPVPSPSAASPTPALTPAPTPAPSVPSANPVAAAPAAPVAAAPTNDAFARAPATALASEGTGSGAADVGFNYAPAMLGDQAPAAFHLLAVGGQPPVPQPAVPGKPPTPPVPRSQHHGSASAFLPWARGFKISDNQSPVPQDRIFYTFDYFSRMNYAVNRGIGSPISDMEAYRELLGIEKTFLQGNASIGLRLPINTLWTNSVDAAFKNNSTAMGNMTIFSKFVLLRNASTGSLLSGGLAVTVPNGPTTFAGSPNAFGFHDAQIQPYLGYLIRRKDWFVQGFTAIDTPTDPHDVTMWYNDVAVGYYAYRSPDRRAFLTAVIPTLELHLSDPLNHRGAFRPNDPVGTPDVLDMTFGSSFVLGQRVIASFCGSVPLTGPRPFNIEAMALLNIYYGRMGPIQASAPPPVGGG